MPPLPRPTLLFDLDGTLIDSIPDLLASCNRVMTARGFAPFTRDEVTPMVGDGAPVLVQRIMAGRGQTYAPDDLRAFIADYTAHAADQTRPYPGIPECLDRLGHAGWRLAICTNKPAAPARAVLEKLELLHYFAAIGAGDSYPVRKPHPQHLLATLAEAGGQPDNAVMVGDHHNDIAAAKAANIPCIFAAWGYGTVKMAEAADRIARSADAIPGLAAELAP